MVFFKVTAIFFTIFLFFSSLSIRSSRWQLKIGVLKRFTICKGKHLCWSLFLSFYRTPLVAASELPQWKTIFSLFCDPKYLLHYLSTQSSYFLNICKRLLLGMHTYTIKITFFEFFSVCLFINFFYVHFSFLF